ncbi:MAG: hypothetical protein JXP73_08285 [Deltaproteobacteria bacterium]|nr:hypothetical protein [Deltaproteobacteria bacterium]
MIAHRLLGPSRSGTSADGSFVELQVAGTEHRFPHERFAMSTAEWTLAGRLDLRRLAPHLEGAFAELGIGTGYQVTRFELRGVSSMGSALLLSRSGFGIYVGDQRAGGGEWSVYYDHRHDGYEAGLLMPGLGSGVAGHLGVEGHHYLDAHWGLGVAGSVGSAVVLGVSARFRQWGTP